MRVIDADGGQLGVMRPEDAIRMALQKELDLVEVAPAANPPVCRIMDYGKFRYTQKKKAQESRKKSAATRAMNASSATAGSFSPPTRGATVPSAASRSPITAITGIFCT